MASPLIFMALLIAACLLLAAGLAGRGFNARGRWTRLNPETRLLLIGLGVVGSAACYALSGRLERDMGEPPDTSEDLPPPAQSAGATAPAAPVAARTAGVAQAPAPRPAHAATVALPRAWPASVAVPASAPQPAMSSGALAVERLAAKTAGSRADARAHLLPPPQPLAPASSSKWGGRAVFATVPGAPCPVAMFRIHVLDHLYRNQQHEHVTLWIEGRRVAEFEVDRRRHYDRVDVRLPWPGRVRYRLEGEIDWSDGTRSTVKGDGCINVRSGRRFRIFNDGTHEQPALFLRRSPPR